VAHVCEHCGKPMPPGKRRHARYCSHAHRQVAYDARARARRQAERVRRQVPPRPWVPPWQDGYRPTIEDLIAAEQAQDPFAVVGQVVGWPSV